MQRPHGPPALSHKVHNYYLTLIYDGAPSHCNLAIRIPISDEIKTAIGHPKIMEQINYCTQLLLQT